MPYQLLIDTALPPTMLDMLGDSCEIHFLKDALQDEALLGRIDGYLTYGHPPTDGALMDRMPNLKVISNFGVGVDHINLADARARHIPVGNTPGFVDGATADLTFALLMAIGRNLRIGDRYARGPEFTAYDPNLFHGQEIYGSTLGIVGMGRIGRVVAKRANGFEMNILYHNRNRDPESEEALGVSYASLNELLQQSDFVTLNMPLTPETRRMIGRKQLLLMKPTAYLINVARGGVLDHDALLEALQNRWIAGAAIDVTEPEPLPRDHPLLQMENLIIAPHLGSATRQSRYNMARRTIDNLLAGLRKESLPSRVG
ncbi:MAG: D-glycerate dehydrogenase [Caldilineaceae bacterium]|nr:D-glycerate dehydrogenase [Caldilineaceae bacterium]HRJ41000.1 D-glycerate dehydrogenase [Caldilineaceae bacterium]